MKSQLMLESFELPLKPLNLNVPVTKAFTDVVILNHLNCLGLGLGLEV